jgi:hypothetical protein
MSGLFLGFGETGTSEVSGKRLCRATGHLDLYFNVDFTFFLPDDPSPGCFCLALVSAESCVANGESSAMRSGCSHKRWTTRNLVSLELVRFLSIMEDRSDIRVSICRPLELSSSLPVAGSRRLTRLCRIDSLGELVVRAPRLHFVGPRKLRQSFCISAASLSSNLPASILSPAINASWPEEASMVGDAALAPHHPPAGHSPSPYSFWTRSPARSGYPDARSPISPSVCHPPLPPPTRHTRVSGARKRSKTDLNMMSYATPVATLYFQFFLGRAV